MDVRVRVAVLTALRACTLLLRVRRPRCSLAPSAPPCGPLCPCRCPMYPCRICAAQCGAEAVPRHPGEGHPRPHPDESCGEGAAVSVATGELQDHLGRTNHHA